MNTWPAQKALSGQQERDPSHFFKCPFCIEDLMVFDDATLRRLLVSGEDELSIRDLAYSLHKTAGVVVERIAYQIAPEQTALFEQSLLHPLSIRQIYEAREQVLNHFFWDLIYWKAPELYHKLTEGELLHPAIFEHLDGEIRGHVILDAAAGSGRASFECLQHGARLIYAVDPSPGLLCVLKQKLMDVPLAGRIIPRQGCFDQLPLEDNSVDMALVCSAFTSRKVQGGDRGLAELRRVTKSGGKVVIIWPLLQDYAWFASRGFQYISFSPQQEPRVCFRSRESALEVAKIFYGRKPDVACYILEHERPEVPYSILGFSQPNDYCWLVVQKD